MNELVIRIVGQQQIASVSQVHLAAFEDSALTLLGRKSVERYYSWLIDSVHQSYNIAVYKNDICLGFCFSGRFNGSMSGYLRKNKYFLIFRACTTPRLWLSSDYHAKLLFAARSVLRIKRGDIAAVTPTKNEVKRPFGVLSIAVRPDYQGSGAANLLLLAAERHARQSGYQEMNLTVHPANARATAFYLKNGWEKVENEGFVWSGRMRKSLLREDVTP